MAREIEGGTNLSASEWHDKIYELATAANIETKEIFKAIYMALLKKPSGPRAGWLLASLDSEFLKERFEAAGLVNSKT
jgi:lysyl-tRNA synthetase class I